MTCLENAGAKPVFTAYFQLLVRLPAAAVTPLQQLFSLRQTSKLGHSAHSILPHSIPMMFYLVNHDLPGECRGKTGFYSIFTAPCPSPRCCSHPLTAVVLLEADLQTWSFCALHSAPFHSNDVTLQLPIYPFIPTCTQFCAPFHTLHSTTLYPITHSNLTPLHSILPHSIPLPFS
jgi:hypothetical protein